MTPAQRAQDDPRCAGIRLHICLPHAAHDRVFTIRITSDTDPGMPERGAAAGAPATSRFGMRRSFSGRTGGLSLATK